MEELLNRMDVKIRLHNSIIMYKGEPHYVSVNDSDGDINPHNVKVFPIGITKPKDVVVDYRCDEFSSCSPPLGYINHQIYGIGYLVRLPTRQFSAGLTRLNIADKLGRLFIDDSVLFSKDMRDCILGNHASFEECYNSIVVGKCHDRAFDRHFSLRLIPKVLGISLYHRTEEIARFVNQQNGKRKLVSLVPETLVPRYNELLKNHGVVINEYF